MRDFMIGAVRVHVLHHAAGGEVHGTWLIEELRRHGHRLGPGTLYPLLHRMEEAGLLSSRTEVVGGRRRRRYRATPGGLAALASCRRAVRELAGELLAEHGAGGGEPSATRAGPDLPDLPETPAEGAPDRT